MRYDFEASSAPTIAIGLNWGSVHVETHAERTTTVTVTGTGAEDVDVSKRGSTIAVHPRRRRGPGRDVTVTIAVPEGATLLGRMAAASLTTKGRLKRVRVGIGKGDIALDAVSESVVAKTGFGSVRVGRVDKGAVVATGFGDITVGVPDGVPVLADLSTHGRIRTEIESRGEPAKGEPYVRLQAKSGTGDIVLRPAS